MRKWIDRAQQIQPLDASWRKRARARINSQTRPKGSLGQLEDVMERLAAIYEQEPLPTGKKQVLIFASDHGVEAEGVSAYPKSVTQAMVHNFLNGGATINALAREVGAAVRIVDVGVDGNFSAHEDLVCSKIRRGSRNFKWEPAMTAEELDQALTVGFNEVEQAVRANVRLFALGEMGIANTTSASAVVAACLQVEPEMVTGAGTGLTDEQQKHKVQVIRDAVARHQEFLNDPLSILQVLGGYEIAAMTGALLAACEMRTPVIVDGWVVAASALVAVRLNPNILDYLFFGHESQEKGHGVVFEALRARPMLDLSMRLGEASGATLAMGIVASCVRIYNEVATFEEAQVADRREI